MSKTILASHSPQETTAIAKEFAKRLTNGMTVAMTGELGAGKTHFIKGLCNGLGYKGVVSSPSYLHLHTYPIDNTLVVYHADLYLAKSANDVIDLGLDEIVLNGGILIIEWAKLHSNALHHIDWEVELLWNTEHEEHRVIIIHKLG